ncbi:inner membrane transport permease yadH, partial [Yersinia pestis PY-47]
MTRLYWITLQRILV